LCKAPVGATTKTLGGVTLKENLELVNWESSIQNRVLSRGAGRGENKITWRRNPNRCPGPIANLPGQSSRPANLRQATGEGGAKAKKSVYGLGKDWGTVNLTAKLWTRATKEKETFATLVTPGVSFQKKSIQVREHRGLLGREGREVSLTPPGKEPQDPLVL